MAIGMALCLLPLAVARADTDSVTIEVGYFGTTYVEVADMSISEMEEELSYACGEYTYSSIDEGYYTRYNLAYGVDLEELLEYAGIAVDDISEIYFFGSDGYSNGQETAAALFDTRYYFPHLAVNYNREYPDDSDVGLITSDRQRVPTILAFEQSLTRDSGNFDYNTYKARMSSTNCLRLVFGQTVWKEISTSDSVYDVAHIKVMLAGSPLRADSDMDLEYGATRQVSYRVSTGVAKLDELIKNGLTFTSDNTNVVYVDPYGNMEARNPGTAHITIAYQDPDDIKGVFKQTITVTVGDKPADPEEQEPVPGDPGEENPDDDNPDEKEPEEQEPDEKEPGEENPDEENPDEEEPDDKENDSYPTTSGTDNGTGGNDSGAGSSSTGASGINGDRTGSVNAGDSPDGGTAINTSVGSPLWSGLARLEGLAEDDSLQSQLTGEKQSEDMLEIVDLSSLSEEEREQIEDLIEQAQQEQTQQEQAAEEEILAEESGDGSVSNTDGLDSGMYLSLGNVAGAGTVDGSGGKALELEEWSSRDTLILLASLIVMFAIGVVYRILRFRKDTR